jgi:sporulation protein YlmC with PRC-barrel domain
MADRDTISAPARLSGWRAALLAHRPVVDVRNVEQMGDVADLVFDPHSRQLVGLLLQRAGAEGTVVEMARRALGSAWGLRFVPIERVIALSGDVVTVDPTHAPTAPFDPAAHQPRLSKVAGFAVVTTRGQRLGRLVDLLLDDGGRHIQGYLVEPGGRGVAPQRTASVWTRVMATQDEPAQDEPAQDEPAQDDTAEAEPPAGAPRPAELMVVPATLDVRVGRNLVIIADTASQGTTTSGDEWTASPGNPAHASSAPRWEPWEADAPTEQMRN